MVTIFVSKKFICTGNYQFTLIGLLHLMRLYLLIERIKALQQMIDKKTILVYLFNFVQF